MKRGLCIALAYIFILSLCTFCGCDTSGGYDVCMEFLDNICSRNYSVCYDLISDSCKRTAESAESVEVGTENFQRPVSESKTVSYNEFVSLYDSFFSTLNIDSISYSVTSSLDGEYMAVIRYTMNYQSSDCGTLTNSFELTASLEKGVWKIEWSPSLLLPDMTWGDSVAKGTLTASRGEIYAPGGYILAETVGYVSVCAVPSKIVEETLFVSQVAELLSGAGVQISPEEVQAALDKAYNDLAIIVQLHPSKLDKFTEENLLLVDGILIDSGSFGETRSYPYAETLAQTIGYIGAISPERKDSLNEGRESYMGLYTDDSIVGVSGLESKYEAELRGADGYYYYIKSEAGERKSVIFTRHAINGRDIELTVNMPLQLRLDEVMEHTLFGEKTSGAVVVMNPKTGEIQAMASYPTFDLNIMTSGSSEERANLINNAPNSPFLNKATRYAYPPGSILKPFTAAAALSNNAITTDYVFSEEIVDDYWKPVGHGPWEWHAIKRAEVKVRSTPLNLHNAMIHSDNIYFANAALLVGAEDFVAYLEKIGFDEAIGFDLSVSSPNLVNKDEEVTKGMIADMGYGQAQLLVTPLQAAAMFSAFANGGDIPVPYIVRALHSGDSDMGEVVWEHIPSVWREDVVSDYIIDKLTPMLEHVVSPDYNGTGRPLRVKNYTIAGKTGTAEMDDSKTRAISWFVGYRVNVAPEDERLVIVALDMPTDEKYASLKFDIARAMLDFE